MFVIQICPPLRTCVKPGCRLHFQSQSLPGAPRICCQHQHLQSFKLWHLVNQPVTGILGIIAWADVVVSKLPPTARREGLLYLSMGHAAEAAGAKVHFDAGCRHRILSGWCRIPCDFFALQPKLCKGGCTVLLKIVGVPWKFDRKLLTGMARTQHWKALPCWSWDFVW